jgi:predicted site-specific integrase-resolvase
MSLKNLWAKFYQRLVDGGAKRSADRKIESAVLEEIERIIRETDATILPVRRFRKKILPSVRHAMQYISGLTSQVPGPVELDPGRWDDDPLLKAIFISREELTGVLQSSKALKNFFKRTNVSAAFAMLVADRKEKNFFGIEKNGEIVRRDVPQKAVFFENFRVIDPATDLTETRVQIQHLALVTLFRQAFEKITALQLWKEELEKHKDLLEFKVKRTDISETVSESKQADASDNQMQETLHVLGDINKKLKEIETELDTPEHRLSHLCSILKNPEQHLHLKAVSYKLNRLGIRLDPSSTEPANEFTVAEFEVGEDLKQMLLWIRVDRASVLSV